MKKEIRVQFKPTPVFRANQYWYDHPSNPRIIANQGATRSSKTYSIMQFLIVQAITNHKKKITVASQSVPHLKRGAISDFLEIMERSRIYDAYKFNLTDKVYTFHTGSTISFISCDDPNALRGSKRDILFINEANLIRKEAYDQLAMRTREKIFIDYNPSQVHSYVYDLLKYPDTAFIRSTYRHNLVNLSPEQIKQIERYNPATNPDGGNLNMWLCYGLGQRVAAESQIYTHWKLIADDDIPEPEDTVLGIDFGFNHPTVVTEVNMRDGVYYVRELFYESGKTNSDLIAWLKSRDIKKNTPIYADAAEPARIQEIRRNGYNIKQANKAVVPGIDFVKGVPLYISKEATNLIREAQMYVWQTDKAGNVIDLPIKANDDGMDSMRYAMFSHYGKPKKKAFLS